MDEIQLLIYIFHVIHSSHCTEFQQWNTSYCIRKERFC